VDFTTTCAQFFNGYSLLGPQCVVVEDGIMRSITPTTKSAEFDVISVGLVDLQMNGFNTVDVSRADTESFALLDQELSVHGTTSWLGTIVTAPLVDMLDTLNRLDEMITEVIAPGCIGIHVEGPFLGGAPGAHNVRHIVDIDMEWLRQLPASVRLVTLAAEQIRAPEAIAYLRSRNVVASLGHSRPTRQQIDTAVHSGATMTTHLFNGMSGVHHRNEGLALSGLTMPQIRTGLIADMVHVSDQIVALTFAAKGDSGVVLVSDSIAWNSPGASARGITIRNGAPRLADDTLAGSCTPLAQCVANAVKLCGVSLEQALRAATSTPATTIGRIDIGRLSIDQPADLVAFDSNLSVIKTWRRLSSERA